MIGNSGAGKSTLAAVLSRKTGLPLIASDPFYWKPDWEAALPEAVRQRVTEATAADVWVIDGNFDSERDVVWARADTVIWLDYPAPACAVARLPPEPKVVADGADDLVRKPQGMATGKSLANRGPGFPILG